MTEEWLNCSFCVASVVVDFTSNRRRNNHSNRGRLVPPAFRLGDQQRIDPPNFLAVVFKTQEISQQVVTRMQDLASEFAKIFRG